MNSPNLPDETVRASGGADGGHGEAGDTTLTAARENLALPRFLGEQPGEWIGRYKLLQKLGEGGCGVVYLAGQQEPLRRRVALKVIKLGMDTRQVIARFEAERQTLALMDHPGIAKVLDAGATDTGRPYFVMELVRGIRLTDYCDQNRLSTQERLALFIKVCQAVQHAHDRGIIHRDLKPSNILVPLPAPGQTEAPKVIDFGIAKATEQRLTDKTLFTALDQFIGTPAYMSPEQAEMSALEIDHRSDLYSLGVVLYELLTGKTPFDPETLLASGVEALRRTLREEEPLPPSTRLRALGNDELTTTAKRRKTEAPKLIHLVRGDLDWVVMKCLEKDRTRRYPSATALAQDVQYFLEHRPVEARPPSVVYRVQKLVRRHRQGMMVAGSAALVVMLTTILAIAIFRAPLVRVLKPPAATPIPDEVRALPAGNVLRVAYSGSPPGSPLATAPPQLELGLLANRNGEANYVTLKDGDPLRSNDDFYRLEGRALSSGYLYIFQVDASGQAQWLFPTNQSFENSSGLNPVKTGQPLHIPPEVGRGFHLDNTLGIEHIYVVFSAVRWPELEIELAKASRRALQPGSQLAQIEHPNGLRTRGIAGIRATGIAPSQEAAVAAARVYSSAALPGPSLTRPVAADGSLLVFERWFKHVPR